jgi:hypothetical protein
MFPSGRGATLISGECFSRHHPADCPGEVEHLFTMARMIETSRVIWIELPEYDARPFALADGTHIREFASREITGGEGFNLSLSSGASARPRPGPGPNWLRDMVCNLNTSSLPMRRCELRLSMRPFTVM